MYVIDVKESPWNHTLSVSERIPAQQCRVIRIHFDRPDTVLVDAEVTFDVVYLSTGTRHQVIRQVTLTYAPQEVARLLAGVQYIEAPTVH